ncbi:hypothetical protein DERF_011481, partial [Dermatophagoides farinae]
SRQPQNRPQQSRITQNRPQQSLIDVDIGVDIGQYQRSERRCLARRRHTERMRLLRQQQQELVTTVMDLCNLLQNPARGPPPFFDK